MRLTHCVFTLFQPPLFPSIPVTGIMKTAPDHVARGSGFVLISCSVNCLRPVHERLKVEPYSLVDTHYLCRCSRFLQLDQLYIQDAGSDV